MNLLTPDKWGNEWMADAVPSGIEIAEVMHEIRTEFGWQEMWSDCAGLRICPRVRVWLDGYQDRDYEEAFLLRVWTKTGDVEVTDHLAILTNASGADSVEWRQDPRLFFDADYEWGYKGLRWWVDWLEGESEARGDASRLPDELHQLTVKHNREVRRRDREKAIAMGINLPYFAGQEDFCSECGAPGEAWPHDDCAKPKEDS